MKNTKTTFVPKGAESHRTCRDGSYACRMIKMTCTYYDRNGNEVGKSIQWYETKPWSSTPCYTHTGEHAAKMNSGEWTAMYEYEETDRKPDCANCIYRYRGEEDEG